MLISASGEEICSAIYIRPKLFQQHALSGSGAGDSLPDNLCFALRIATNVAILQLVKRLELE
jgi:hypothetical protein